MLEETRDLLRETVQDLGRELTLVDLMDHMVDRISAMVGCERSSVFLYDAASDELYALKAQGLEEIEIRLPAQAGLIGAAASKRVTLNIEDAYQDTRFNHSVDQQSGFRTRSVLALPFMDRQHRLLGVVECLNKLGADAFGKDDEEVVSAFSSLASVFLENARLYYDLDTLLDAVVSVVSEAIDDRDPATSGHSLRVTKMAMRLAKAVHASKQAPFKHVTYTRERLRALRIACLLHDAGKIGVREHILTKSRKLPPLGEELILTRLDALRERHRAETYKGIVDHGAGDMDALHRLENEIAEARTLVTTANAPVALAKAMLDGLNHLKERGWITAGEHEYLTIANGTLTPAEVADMQKHVVLSSHMLSLLPWPADLAEIPVIAGAHHERMDGQGFPRKLTRADIPLDARILAVCDMYDALTARDRPYKKATPHDQALGNMLENAGHGGLDPDLVDLFFARRCHEEDAR